MNSTHYYYYYYYHHHQHHHHHHHVQNVKNNIFVISVTGYGGYIKQTAESHPDYRATNTHQINITLFKNARSDDYKQVSDDTYKPFKPAYHQSATQLTTRTKQKLKRMPPKDELTPHRKE
jgi:hypothetical protein